jgi:hypothetical protein
MMTEEITLFGPPKPRWTPQESSLPSHALNIWRRLYGSQSTDIAPASSETECQPSGMLRFSFSWCLLVYVREPCSYFWKRTTPVRIHNKDKGNIVNLRQHKQDAAHSLAGLSLNIDFIMYAVWHVSKRIILPSLSLLTLLSGQLHGAGSYPCISYFVNLCINIPVCTHLPAYSPTGLPIYQTSCRWYDYFFFVWSTIRLPRRCFIHPPMRIHARMKGIIHFFPEKKVQYLFGYKWNRTLWKSLLWRKQVMFVHSTTITSPHTAFCFHDC